MWHHRRGSVSGYLKQQFEYGKAEALLERKWPERYNRMGHLAWAGRVYGAPLSKVLGGRWKIYYGTWGTGLFQSVYQRAPGILGSLPLMPEWYLVIALLAGLSLLGNHVDAAAAGGAAADRGRRVARLQGRARRRCTQASRPPAGPAAASTDAAAHRPALHGPAGRPARRAPAPRPVALAPSLRAPSEPADPPHERHLERALARSRRTRARLESALRRSGGVIFSGGEFERWDLHVRGGMLGSMRMRMAVEEHGGGRQLLRIRSWPRFSRIGAGVALGSAPWPRAPRCRAPGSWRR